jgi:flagellar biosynthesis/type III secretory pathway chaperone
MEKTVKELLIVLEILIANHRELLSCEQSKLEMIIRQDWPGLGEALKRSEQILKSIETAERCRQKLLQDAGIDPGTPMKEVVETLSGEQKKKLLEGTEKLSEVLQSLKSLNGQIQELLSSSLEVINFSISLFQGAGAGSKTYCVTGEEKRGEERYTSLVLDTKV